LDEVVLELIDTAGLESARDAISEQAQRLRLEQGETADFTIWCHDLSTISEPRPDRQVDLLLGTKADRTPLRKANLLAVSGVTGEGLAELRERLVSAARHSRRPSTLAPSWSRCRHHVVACRQHLERCSELVREGDSPELVALELRLGLEQLGELVGAVYTDDLLDRVFSRFCIGK
jgi:tRNA modification GTPase